MELENKKDDIEIDLKELFKALLSKFVVIVLVGALFGAGAYAYTKLCIKPQYTSTTKVYILNKPETNVLNTSDLAFATYLARDYEVLLISDPVLKEVITTLNLNMTTKGLASRIAVSLLEDTRILKINVTADSAQQAKDIADTLRSVAKEKTKEVMGGIEAVNDVDEATLPTQPSSPSYIKNTALGFIGGAGLVIIIIIILFLMDDTIKTQEDIEKYLGISVLASIPLKKDNDGADKKKKKKKKTQTV